MMDEFLSWRSVLDNKHKNTVLRMFLTLLNLYYFLSKPDWIIKLFKLIKWLLDPKGFPFPLAGPKTGKR